ncbi:MAG: DUF2099 family protein [Methanobacteriaceae archaeon]|nr:DUF2099 family protein [Methanobacteriaceae archaeon]
MDEHIIEALGKAKVVIRDGKVVEVGEPIIEFCPLFLDHRDIKTLNKEIIHENMQFRVDDFGMCKKNRQLKMKDFLAFGISEILCTLLRENIIDCGVMVCEGCGTVIVDSPELSQGVGGRVSGLVSTTPIPEVIEAIGHNNVVDTKNASINQVEGAKLAIKNGFKKIAITLANPNDAIELRKLEKEINESNSDDINENNSKSNEFIKFYLFAVHTTGLSREESEIIFDNCDVVTSCASKHIRDIAKERNSFSVGQSIPIFAATNIGEEFLKLRLDAIGGPKPKKDNPKLPYPLI